MSESVEIVDPPLVLFTTRTNQELGANAVTLDDGSVLFSGISKMVTENMLSSYPRSVLGKWTPNRAAVRFTQDEIGDRKVKDFASGKDLDLEALGELAG